MNSDRRFTDRSNGRTGPTITVTSTILLFRLFLNICAVERNTSRLSQAIHVKCVDDGRMEFYVELVSLSPTPLINRKRLFVGTMKRLTKPSPKPKNS